MNKEIRFFELLVTIVFLLLSIAAFQSSRSSIFYWLLILAVGNWFLKQKGGFNLLALVPVFAQIQLLLAPSELRFSSNPFIAYGPMTFEEYGVLAIPLTTSFCLPFFLPQKNGRDIAGTVQNEAKWGVQIKSLIFLGLFFQFFFYVVQDVPVLGALAYYASMLWKVCIPMSFFHLRRPVFPIGLMLLLLIQSYSSTFWWDFVMVGVITVVYGFAIHRIKIFSLSLSIFLGGVFLLGMQTVKHLQRSGVEITSAEITDVTQALMSDESRVILSESLLGRLNQGIHDSFVYDRRQTNVSTVGTILPSFLGVFLPRAIYSEKPAFDSSKFIALGGYREMGNSFITLSGVAEACANFGIIGGCVFLFLYSLGLCRVWMTCSRLFRGPLVLLLAIPFYHVIRVEVDFYHWFTSLFYGLVVALYIRKMLDNRTIK